VAKRKEVAIQPSTIAFNENSFPIDGKAKLMAELIKGVINELRVVIIKI
jgi:hypothetical protein